MDRNDILNKFNTLVSKSSVQARDLLWSSFDCSSDGYLLSLIALTYRDEAIFFKNGNLRKVPKKDPLFYSKFYIDKSYNLTPNCITTLYTKGTIYDLHDELEIAISCFEKILNLSLKNVKEFNCNNESKSYIAMVVNDAKLKLYQLYYDIGDKEQSDLFLQNYKEGVSKGVNTIYTPLSKFLKE